MESERKNTQEQNYVIRIIFYLFDISNFEAHSISNETTHHTLNGVPLNINYQITADFGIRFICHHVCVVDEFFFNFILYNCIHTFLCDGINVNR